ncbi:MAG: energy transducer TonB [Desulfobulbaceae bacterium]|nr:energy transducer TonB [Desulfobulbaceae bacterium]
MLTIDAVLLSETLEQTETSLPWRRTPAWLLPLAGAAVVHLCLLLLLLIGFHLAPRQPQPLPEVIGVALYTVGDLPTEASSSLPAELRAAPPPPQPVHRSTRRPRPVAPAPSVAVASAEVPAHPSLSPQAAAPQEGESASVRPEVADGAVRGTAGAGGAGAAATVVLARPRYRENPSPPYPEPARRRQLEGTVVLEVLVSTQGQVSELLVSTSSGHRLLDEAALQAVKGWRFEPGQRGGVAMAMNILVPVRFDLR